LGLNESINNVLVTLYFPLGVGWTVEDHARGPQDAQSILEAGQF